METLEINVEESFKGIELRCKGWCHDVEKEAEANKIELRCKGWCHDMELNKVRYQTELPSTEYFN